MASGVPVLVRLLRVWASVVRLLGGFPYTWDHHNNTPGDTGHHTWSVQSSPHTTTDTPARHNHYTTPRTRDNNSSRPHREGWRRGTCSGGQGTCSGGQGECGQCSETGTMFPGLQPTRNLALWSHFILLLHVVLIAAKIIYKFVLKGVETGGSSRTVITTANIINVVEVLVLLSVCLHLLMSRATLSSLLEHLDHITPYAVASTCNIIRDGFFIVIVVSYTAIVTCYISFWIKLFQHRASSYIEILGTSEVLLIIIQLPITILSNIALYVIGYLVVVLLKDITNNIVRTQKLKENEEAMNIIERREDGSEDKPRRMESQTREVVQAVCTRVSELCHFQTLINNHFSMLILTFMARSVAFIILDVYMSIIPQASSNIAFRIVFTINRSLELALLCCTPDLVTNQLRKLRFTVCRWRLAAQDHDLDHQLTYLLDLLDNYPAFSVGGFYVVAKARLVDVASFIATYLVILLQFQAGEDPRLTPTPAQ